MRTRCGIEWRLHHLLDHRPGTHGFATSRSGHWATEYRIHDWRRSGCNCRGGFAACHGLASAILAPGSCMRGAGTHLTVRFTRRLSRREEGCRERKGRRHVEAGAESGLSGRSVTHDFIGARFVRNGCTQENPHLAHSRLCIRVDPVRQ